MLQIPVAIPVNYSRDCIPKIMSVGLSALGLRVDLNFFVLFSSDPSHRSYILLEVGNIE